MTIKAIETNYNGYRFRSRLEARWAVFFDSLGVPYEYEKEGFNLGEAGWYLPDFWLPEQNCWVEIKPDTSCLCGDSPFAHLGRRVNDDVLVFCGGQFAPFEEVIESDLTGKYFRPTGEYKGSYGYLYGHVPDPSMPCGADSIVGWAECADCIRAGAKLSYVGIPFASAWAHSHFESSHLDWDSLYDTPRLRVAYTAARSARFEHR